MRYLLGKKEKLINRLKSRPKDFTFDETEALLKMLSYRRDNKGKTSGSRVVFVSDEHGRILLHRPHPRNILKEYQIQDLVDTLEREGLI